MLYAGIKPKTHFDPQLLTTLHDRRQAIRETVRIGCPVIRVIPDILKTATISRVRATSGLPSVIDLEMSDTQLGCQFQFLQTKSLVHTRILSSVSPGIQHHHLVAVFEERADTHLVITKRHPFLFLTRTKCSGHIAISLCPLVSLYIRTVDTQTDHSESTLAHQIITSRIVELYI